MSMLVKCSFVSDFVGILMLYCRCCGFFLVMGMPICIVVVPCWCWCWCLFLYSISNAECDTCAIIFVIHCCC